MNESENSIVFSVGAVAVAQFHVLWCGAIGVDWMLQPVASPLSFFLVLRYVHDKSSFLLAFTVYSFFFFPPISPSALNVWNNGS